MKYKKTLIASSIGLGLIAAYAVAGFWILPAVAERKLPDIVKDLTGQTLRLGELHFNPFEMRLAIDDVELSDAGGASLLAFQSLAIDIGAIESLHKRGIVLSEIHWLQPVVNIERRPDGRFNFADAVPKSPEQEATTQPQQPSELIDVWLDTLSISDGQLRWRDTLGGADVTETLTAIDLSLSDFTTQAAEPFPFNLSLRAAAGGELTVTGKLGLSPLLSQGEIRLNALPLSKISAMFVQPYLPIAIRNGVLTLATQYDFSMPTSALDLRFEQGTLTINQLEVTESAGTAPLLTIPSLDVSGIQVDVGKQQVQIGRVATQNGAVKAWLQPDGRVNYQALFAPSESAAPSQAPVADETSSAKPWLIAIDDLAIQGYQVHFTDQTLKKPLELALNELEIGIQHFRSDQNQALPVQFGARLNESGHLKLNGNLLVSPFSADWAIELAAIDLKTFQGYIDPFVQLDLIDGKFNTQGQLALKSTPDMQIVYRGNAQIDDLITRDKAKNKDFVKWKQLAFDQMAIDVARQDYRFAKVIFEKPYFRFNIKKDGSTNIDDILVSNSVTAAKPSHEPVAKKSAKGDVAKAASDPVISIGKIEMKAGESDFADYSLILPFVAQIKSLQGEVDGFTSNTDDAAKLKLQGKVYDLATVNIDGKHQFKSGDSAIALKFSHMPLPLITPYMAEFAGYRIERGQMALDLKYSIKQGQLEAQNKIFIDQLTLGEKVENPKAVSLPLDFAIALLKDSDGKINLDFPISGSLNDPKFSVASLVADVLVNLVKKTVTSPFKAIASLMNGDDDYSAIAFKPGDSTVSPEEAGKLAGIAKALQQKTELVLEIKGLSYEVLDWPAMRTSAVTDILKRMKSGELRDKGENVLMEYIELSDSDYKRLLAKFYAEVFPSEIDYSLLGAPRMKNNSGVEFYSTALMQLEAIMQPETQRMNDLAVERANQIAKHLIDVLGVDRSRIFVLATELKVGDRETPLESILSLNVRS